MFLRGLIVLFLAACSGEETPPQAGGLGGEWRGVYSLRNATGILTTTSKATIDFTEKMQFTSSIVGESNARASGSYQEFQGRSLLLNIVESNDARLGVGGSTLDFNYTLTENELHLSGPTGEFKLVRALEQSAANDGNSSSDAIVGWWTCQDDNGNSWSIDVQGSKEFWAQVSSTGGQPLMFQGHYYKLSSEGSQYVFRTTSSTNSDIVGSMMRMTTSGNSGLFVEILDKDAGDPATAQALDSVNCSKSS